MNDRSKAICIRLSSAMMAAAVCGGVAQAQTTMPATLAAPTTVPSTKKLVADGVDANGQVNLLMNKSVVITTTKPYSRVNVAQPDVADVNAVGGSSILVTAKKPGTTQLIIWDENDNTQVADIVVMLDVNSLQGEMTKMFPSEKIEVSGINGSIALRGKVKDLQTAEQAVQIASPYGTKVLNFLETPGGGQQVVLQVRFAEVSRTATTALGVNFGLADGTGSFGNTVGNVSSLFPGNGSSGASGSLNGAFNAPTSSVGSGVTQFGGGVIGSTAFEVFLSALRDNNLLRILAEPNLVTTSGQEAQFLAGGEFPVPVPSSGSNNVSIEYREFGVRLKFVPVVLGGGKIRLKVSPEVSDLDFTIAVNVAGTRVPGLRKRNLTTTIEMNEGQTFAVGGLLNQTVTSSRTSTPLLGDIPILGVLFRSVRYARSETELVVLVTPKIVSAMNPDEVPKVPGETWRHPNEAELFLNKDIGGPEDAKSQPGTSDSATTKNATAASPAPRYIGQNGFSETSKGQDASASTR